ncbi:MAG: hypothetical protein Q4D96_07295 [Propionibacteriaceae bacterium]|nr:hypothetical protein [Propionibacteriaceae bacterium]
MEDYREHIAALQQALARPDITDAERAEIHHHLQRLIEAQEAEDALERMTLWVADRTGQLVLEDQGFQVVLGMASATPEEHHAAALGHFTQVAIGGPDVTPISENCPRHEHNVVVFQENKAGEEYRLETYEGAQQGSFAYIKNILLSGRDPRLAAAFDALRSTGQYPGFIQALRHGAVQIQYHFVQAVPDGTVRVGTFNVDDNARLRWNGGTVELLM